MANEYADHTTMRSALGRVRGLGPAKQGVGHWWLQRVSSALLLPLTLWFAVSAALLAGASHEETVAWIASPFNAVLLLATLAISFQHTASGVQNILEDYVNQEWLRMGAILAQKTIFALLWLASTLAVLRIAI